MRDERDGPNGAGLMDSQLRASDRRLGQVFDILTFTR
jgi:hypothetical protein